MSNVSFTQRGKIMLLPVVVDQVRRLARRYGEPGVVAPRMRPSPGLMPAQKVKLLAAVPRGLRYQVFRALRAMDQGQRMVVERRIPQLTEHFENERKRQQFFQSLRDPAGWMGKEDLYPVLVPGTCFASVIGGVLLRSGCCAPSETPHWVPNLRFFYLTELGHETALKAKEWWAGLDSIERLKLMLLE
jgi:hypothetical protein